jgi:glutaredoxin 3
MRSPACVLLVFTTSPAVTAFVTHRRPSNVSIQVESSTGLKDMKRPILDQIATALFKLENNRVEASSVPDEKGRIGEPMEWSDGASSANKFSELIASNPLGYRFKQWVADIVAGEYDEAAVSATVDEFIAQNEIAMFSFTTCPFCRRAKDALDEQGLSYQSLELDELGGNKGNEIRAILGKKTKRTSVPSIFIRGQYIGGCNDGPGLLPLMQSGEFDKLLAKT